MPVVPVPITAPDPVDLITGVYSTNVLAASGITLTAAQAAVQASLITAASREIIRYLGNRPIALQAFTEIVVPEGERQDRGEKATAKLARFPVVAITRCATGRATALTIANNSAANQEASVVFTATGDVDFDNLVYTGLTLSRTASGVVTTNTVPWTTSSPYTTIAAVAASINALGGGWSATTTANLSLLPAAYLMGVREPKDALAGAALDVFATTYTGYAIERSTGILRCNGGWGWFDGWGDSDYAFGDWGGPQLEVRYTAGFQTVPENLQLATAEVVQLMLQRLGLDSSLKSETTGKYSWVARDAIGNLSDGAMATLGYYKDWKI